MTGGDVNGFVILGAVIGGGLLAYIVKSWLPRQMDKIRIQRKGSSQSGDGELWSVYLPGKKMPSRLLWANSLGGVLNECNGFPVNTLDPGKPVSEMREWLSSSWATHTADDARLQLDSLLESGHRAIFDRIFAIGDQYTRNELSDIITNEYSEALADVHDLGEFVDNYSDCIPKLTELGYIVPGETVALTTAAYDFGRAVTVARVCLGAELLDEAEVQAYILKIGDAAQAKFDSWPSFARSYLLGRGIWGDVNDSEFTMMHEIARFLLNNSNSQWRREAWPKR